MCINILCPLHYTVYQRTFDRQLRHCGVYCYSFIVYLVINWIFFLPAFGAAYGTAKSGTGIAAMSVMRPELIMKSIIPVVMAGIIAIYGLVVAVLIAGALEEPAKYTLFK